MGIDTLAPAQRFMYEYGCFVVYWSNLELIMELLIHRRTVGPEDRRDPARARTTCRQVNPKPAGAKRALLEQHLSPIKDAEVLTALAEVFDIADRNGWIHGVLLNPNRDFSRLSRLRVEKDPSAEAGIAIQLHPIALDRSPFEAFYAALQRFVEIANVTKADMDEYLGLLLAGAGKPVS